MKKLIKYIIAWFRIPRGPYCGKCPYWRGNIVPIKTGDRTIAYCKYLDKTDLDIIKDRSPHFFTELKSGQLLEMNEDEVINLGFVSLLWDGCKECGIKVK